MIDAAVLLLAMATAPASAGVERSPHFCIAEWDQPTEQCSWDQAVSVRASGRSLSSARRHALTRLRSAMDALTRAAEIDAEGTLAELQVQGLAGCSRVSMDDAKVTCLSTPSLGASGLCFAELPDDRCWEGAIRAYTGVAWEVSEDARAQTCAEVDAQISATSESEAERLRCHARCLAAVTVRCPGRG